MESNKFGKVSNLFISAAKKDRVSVISDVQFSAPFKIMTPFQSKNDILKVMFLSASAGIMEGDRQEFRIQVGEEAQLELISQAYEKIHKMKGGSAHRNTTIVVEKNACLRYTPQPTIPFADSAFQTNTCVKLEDETSRFCMGEILTCGRYARQERFAYRFYRSFVEIYRKEKLIYRDNSCYEPSVFDMEGIGMYESFTHFGNFFFTSVKDKEAFIQYVRELIHVNGNLEGGITRQNDDDLAVRIFANRGQVLEELLSDIADCWYNDSI